MSGISKLGLALLLVFVLSILGVSAELLYLVCRRRRSRRDSSAGDDSELAYADGRDGDRSPSKDLILYFPCWKNQSRIEPAASVSPAVFPAASPHFLSSLGAASSKSLLSEAEAVDVDLAKLRGMYASRYLFTIREEEREGVESDGGRSPDIEMMGARRPCSVEEVWDSLSSTPTSSSPVFYTPPSSPPRETQAFG